MDTRPEPPTVRIDGDRIRRLREEKELTQLYVATVVGVTTDTVSRWENRRYQTVKRQNALKLAQALEVDLNDILEKEENRAAPADEAATTGQPSGGNQETPPAAGPPAPATWAIVPSRWCTMAGTPRNFIREDRVSPWPVPGSPIGSRPGSWPG